jgi:cytochrome b involved in lipid metabolism
MRDFKNEQEVYQYYLECKKNIIIFEGTVYDITEYGPTHPGGVDLLEPYYGKCIDEPFTDNGHTNFARVVFRDLEKLGYLAGDGSEKSNAKVNIQGMDGYQLNSKIVLDYSKPIYP